MNFGNPQYLWLLLGAPLLGLLAIRAHKRRARAWKVLELWGRAPGDRSITVLAALILIVLALAQPRIGISPQAPVGPGQDVVLVFDVSRSMGAEDATPNRLALAVETAKSLVRILARQPADRAAVVAFAGRGVPRCPLTQNMGAVVDAMNRLRPGGVQPGGTDLGAALDAAREAFDPNEPTEGRTVVIFSDGEDHDGRWERALERLIRMGVIVHTIGMGDANAGATVPSSAPGRSLIYQGEPVVSKREDKALEAIAERSGGANLKLGLATADLGLLYQDRIVPVANARREAARGVDRPERFPLFLGAALGFLIVGFWPGNPGWPSRWFFRRSAGLVLLGLVLTGQLGAGADEPKRAETPAEAVVRGQDAYAAGLFPEALSAFQKAAALAPGQAVPQYNVGACLFQMGRFAEALASYQSARKMAGASLRTKIDYGLGNTSLSLGDLAGAVRHYDACLASTARGPKLDAVRQDAALNRRFAVEQLLTALSQEDEPEDSGNAQDQSQPKAPPRQSDAQEDDEPGEGPSDKPKDGADADEAQDDPRSSPRKSGGAGGSSRNPPAPSEQSPGDRLDSALEQIQDAQRRRLPAAPPADAPRDDRKDW